MNLCMFHKAIRPTYIHTTSKLGRPTLSLTHRSPDGGVRCACTRNCTKKCTTRRQDMRVTHMHNTCTRPICSTCALITGKEQQGQAGASFSPRQMPQATVELYMAAAAHALSLAAAVYAFCLATVMPHPGSHYYCQMAETQHTPAAGVRERHTLLA